MEATDEGWENGKSEMIYIRFRPHRGRRRGWGYGVLIDDVDIAQFVLQKTARRSAIISTISKMEMSWSIQVAAAFLDSTSRRPSKVLTPYRQRSCGALSFENLGDRWFRRFIRKLFLLYACDCAFAIANRSLIAIDLVRRKTERALHPI